MKYTTALLMASTAFAAPLEQRAVFNSKVETPSTCTLPASYSPSGLTAKLPDPFTFANGTKVTTKDEMLCRQGEISSTFQKYELGTKPPKPETVTGTLSATGISVSVTSGGKTITFSAKINKGSCTAPCPAIIGIGGASIPVPAGVATITFDNDGMAAQQNSNSHGTGLFFQLYGSSATAGATTGWAWGVSRIIDALEQVGSAAIDTTRIGVTGCSRNGKGAYIVGALDSRIALTIPQESGSGGAACWRISDSQKSAGKNIQTASEIIGENAWFSPNFNSYAKATNTLPVDHHMLPAMMAPRGLFVIENDIDWLGPVSTTACQEIGQLAYTAMGAPNNMGFSLVGGHSHCQFPSGQQADLTTFITAFLLKGAAVSAQVKKSSATFTASDYQSYTVPTLT